MSHLTSHATSTLSFGLRLDFTVESALNRMWTRMDLIFDLESLPLPVPFASNDSEDLCTFRDRVGETSPDGHRATETATENSARGSNPVPCGATMSM